jgi:hypothetical protein
LAKPLLEVLRDVSLDPTERAAFAADPADYLAQHGYEDVPPEDLGEAFGLMHDTLPADTAQALAADPVYEAPSAGDPLAFDDAGEVDDMAPFGEVNGDFDTALSDADDGGLDDDDAPEHRDLRTTDADNSDNDGDFGGGDGDVDGDVELGRGFDPDVDVDDDAGIEDADDVGFGLGSAPDGGDDDAGLDLDGEPSFGHLTGDTEDAGTGGDDIGDDDAFGRDLFADLDDVDAAGLHDTGAFGHGDDGLGLGVDDGFDADHGPDDADGLDDIGSF